MHDAGIPARRSAFALSQPRPVVRSKRVLRGRRYNSPVILPRPLAVAALLALAACRIETRPPAGVARTTATVQAAVAEHYRSRNAVAGDSVGLTVIGRATEVRRDLASVWVTLRERRRVSADSTRDTTRYEHLLLRRTDGGWIVLAATTVGRS